MALRVHPLGSCLISIALTCVFLSFVVAPKAGAMRLYYKPTAQVELVSSAGIRVLIDVATPHVLSAPPSAKDVLLTTHNHGDHRRLDFINSFPGPQLDVRVGRIQLGDVNIVGLASAHNEGDEFKPEGGTNYIFIVDMDGMRIAHFGDIGQEALTAEQLAALGKVDIAITQLSNPYSDMNVANKKGFNLMDQVKPAIIIPTHIFEPAATKIAIEKWAAFNFYRRYLTIGRDILPKKTTIVFMDVNAFAAKLPNAVFE